MRFSWENQEAEWFLEASDYTGFHRALAQKIIPHLEPDDTLCDVGCGLGRLTLELAGHVAELTAVDISKNAVDLLRRDAQALGLSNLHTRQGDAAELAESFDVMLLSFFGKASMPGLLRLCRRRLIRVVNQNNKSGLYPRRCWLGNKATVDSVAAELAADGVEYRLELVELEFGQPLKSRRAAERLVLKNAPGAGAAEISDFLDEHIVHTGREDFPFYLPNPKELGIFVIDRR